MLDNKLNYKIINSLALIALVYLLVSTISIWWDILAKCVQVLSPFIIGFAFAYAFTPLVRWLEKKGLKKPLALCIVIFGLIIVLVGLLWITIPMFFDQLSLFAKMVVEVFGNIDAKYNINLGDYEIKVTDYLNNMLVGLGGFASSNGMDYLSKSFGFLGKFIVGFVAFIYFLIDMDQIRNMVKEWLLSISKRSFEYFKLMDGAITNYLKGLEIFMIIQFFEYSLLFLIVGHPNWLVLGALACVTTVIPYFGGLVTNIIAIVLASVVSPKLVFFTILICLIFPQIDGYVISPRIYGRTSDVNPLIVIMAVSIGGTLAGMVGIIAALPVYLLIRTTYHFFKMDLKKGMVIVKRTI